MRNDETTSDVYQESLPGLRGTTPQVYKCVRAHLNLFPLCEPLLAACAGLPDKGHGLDGGPVLGQARHHLVHRVPASFKGYQQSNLVSSTMDN